MGQGITRSEFSPEDFERFHEHLLVELAQLKQCLAQPDFGGSDWSLGAELELDLVDQQARPLMLNTEVIQRSGDPQLAYELNRYNLEYNLTPVSIAQKPFYMLEREMCHAISHIKEQLSPEQGQALAIGILPTLKRQDLSLKMMTSEARFQALNKGIQRLRGKQSRIYINGAEPIALRSHDLTLEGANSSLQLHFKVPLTAYVDCFNAVQLLTPVVLAMAVNSPFLLGQRLWQETRIPLFQQSIDGCPESALPDQTVSRVMFGNGWLRQSPSELFAELVHLFPAVLPIISEAVKADELPHLSLHCGTVWPWNRPVYSADEGGHVRIELRAFPSGPTPADMLANTAFMLGSMVGLSDRINELIPILPYSMLEQNFYRAARDGIDTQLMWPLQGCSYRLLQLPAAQIIESMLPVAEKGLKQLGIESAEISHYLDLVAARLPHCTTGAKWQLKTYKRLSTKQRDAVALRKMVQRYMCFSADNIPVSEWT